MTDPPRPHQGATGETSTTRFGHRRNCDKFHRWWCGVHALSASANQAAPTPSPEICALIDFTTIRAKAAKQAKIALKDAPPNVRDAPDLIDPRSFVAVASAGDLTDAGINTSGIPQNQLEVVIVNHGHWLSNELPMSGAPRGYPAGTTPGPEPTPYVISWQVSVWDVGTYRPRMGIYSPDNPCFNGG